MTHSRQRDILVALVLTLCLAQPTPSAGQEDLSPELGDLVDPEGAAFLLGAIAQIHPSIAVLRLTGSQAGWGISRRGICGLQPGQSMEPDVLPFPANPISEMEAAVMLARQRQINQRFVMDLGFPVEFSSNHPPLPTPWPPANMKLSIDWTAPALFLAALEDGVVSTEDVVRIAESPANIELLQYLADHQGLFGCPVTKDDLEFFVSRSGSSDALNRLYCWLNPMNHFGYADQVLKASQYRRVLDELQTHSQAISEAVLTRIAPFFPPETEVQAVVALSVCCPMSTWETSRMVGVNVQHFKGDWEHVIRILAAAVFDRFQHQLRLSETTSESLIVDDLVTNQTPVLPFEPLELAMSIVVFEGAADYAADLGASDEGKSSIQLGAALLHHYATSATTTEPSPIPGKGVVSCSLSALGRHMARVITAYDGPLAITELIQRGPEAFVLRAAEIESVRGRDLLSQETISAIHELARRN